MDELNKTKANALFQELMVKMRELQQHLLVHGVTDESWMASRKLTDRLNLLDEMERDIENIPVV